LLACIVPIDWIIRNETPPEQIVYFRIAVFLHTIIFLVGFGLFWALPSGKISVNRNGTIPVSIKPCLAVVFKLLL
jgi:hypothetical protein